MLILRRSPRKAEPQPKKGPESPSNSSCSLSPDFSELISFQTEWNRAEVFGLRYRLVRIWWPKVLMENQIPDKNILLLHARISYELQYKAYMKAGIRMPKGVAQNLEAIRAWDVGRMTENVKRMMGIEMRTDNSKGEEMKKTASSKKEASKGVSHLYLEIFEGQAKAQLTDAQIIEAITAKTGVEPTAKNVASYRCMYNAGRLQGQKGVPSAKVKAVRPKKVKAKKPMSEETKTKLKAYSAKKKKLTLKKK